MMLEGLCGLKKGRKVLGFLVAVVLLMSIEVFPMATSHAAATIYEAENGTRTGTATAEVQTLNNQYRAVPPVATVYNVTSYGTLVAGANATIAEKMANAVTIQNAIDAAGAAGGGVVQMPAGTYGLWVAPGGTCIKINYDNITFQGAGKTQTIIKTRDVFDVTAGARANGLRIYGTANPASPRKNIIIRDFELDGGAGWTGNYNYNYSYNIADGWDLSHKGLIVGWDDAVDNVVLEDLYVHHFRSELLYTGGLMVGKVTLRRSKIADTNASTINLYAADLMVDNVELGGPSEPSRFWIEFGARANQMSYPTNRTVIRNSRFNNAVGAQGIAIAQGDLTTYSYTFENNTFANAPKGIFIFTGGVAGPVMIQNNIITNSGGDNAQSKGAILDFEWGGNTANPTNNHISKNITFQNNIMNGSGGPFVDLQGGWDGGATEYVENLKVLNNIFMGKYPANPSATESILYGSTISWYSGLMVNVNLTNVAFDGNKFYNCRKPRQVGTVYGSMPTFTNNTYTNCVP